MTSEQEFLQNVIATMCATAINPVTLNRTLPAMFPGFVVTLSETGVTLTSGSTELVAAFPVGATVKTIQPNMPDLQNANCIKILDADGNVVAEKNAGVS